MEKAPEEDIEDQAPPQEDGKRKIGPLSDYFEEGGPEHYPDDPKTLLEKISAERDPHTEVNVPLERERIGEQLEQISKAIVKEKGKESSLEEVRGELGVEHKQSETLGTLQKVKERLEEDKAKIDIAERMNDTLETFDGMTGEDLKSVAKTGKTSKGEFVRDKRGREVKDLELAKELGGMYQGGMHRMTWGAFKNLEQFVYKILDDLNPIALAKRMMGFGGKS